MSIDLLKGLEGGKTTAWGGDKAAPMSPRDLIGYEARAKAKRWMDAGTAVGLFYKFRNVDVKGQALNPEPLWPIAGVGAEIQSRSGVVGIDEHNDPVTLGVSGETVELIVVYMLREFPVPGYLRLRAWDGYPIFYRVASAR
jgi:hypothetical protein